MDLVCKGHILELKKLIIQDILSLAFFLKPITVSSCNFHYSQIYTQEASLSTSQAF
jgi:hypothetical protein